MFAMIVACIMLLAPPGAKAEMYQRDMEFLTAEIGREAATLIELKRIDWDEVSQEYVELAAKSEDDSAHLMLSHRMLCRLQDGHAGIVDSKVKWPDEGGGRRFTGPRVLLVRTEDGLFVRQAFKNAVEAGVAPGMRVVRIDGQGAEVWFDATVARLRDRFGYSTLHAAEFDACHRGLADWEGTSILFELAESEEEGAARKTVTITRSGGPNYVAVGPVFVPSNCKTLGRQTYGRTAGGTPYIHLRDVPAELPEQIDTMLAAISEVPGAFPSRLIIDMRANGGGGCDHAAVAARFKRGQNVVVIIDSWVRSAGETIAGTFKEDLGFILFGDGPTAGMSSQKKRIVAPSGLFGVQFSVRSNKQRFNGGHGIEGLGITPDRLTPYVASDLRTGVDTQIREAEATLLEHEEARKRNPEPTE